MNRAEFDELATRQLERFRYAMLYAERQQLKARGYDTVLDKLRLRATKVLVLISLFYLPFLGLEVTAYFFATSADSAGRVSATTLFSFAPWMFFAMSLGASLLQIKNCRRNIADLREVLLHDSQPNEIMKSVIQAEAGA